ncbi:penicillin-binding protein 1C [uncultured Helicobacter sp.]|uniref:penicillin-binding protein 1C n=1 Tax=uncultured Helicobacter sp. TaxID=175537 RepID=UPI00374F1619
MRQRIIRISLGILLCILPILGYGAYRFSVLDSLLAPLTSSTSRDPFESQYSKILLDRNGELLSVFLNPNEQWHLKSTQPVPQKLQIAVLEYEDKRFLSHIGVDPIAIVRTLRDNLSRSKRAGASTITMQVAKFLNAKPRTYKNKIDEIFYALRLEHLYTKDEILQMYLNNASYGRNIIGYSGALLLYFGLEPAHSQQLTWAQAALLAVLPNAPGLINLEKNPKALENKRNALLQHLYNKGYFSYEILSLALSEPLPRQLQYRTNLAPHLALRLMKESKDTNPPPAILHSTIDRQIQQRFESRAKQYATILQKDGITNLSALLVDTQSKEVLAYVGSQDFLDIQNYGQIDGILALRSPGSTLKPLLYALSIDEGLIAPYSKLIDVPMFFGTFAPQNASKKYYGLISAQSALEKSLNVPFVRLLQEYGYEKFFFTLKDILRFSDTNYTRYGLSLILGTKEMSVEQIAKIYLGLGNYGVFEDLHYRCDERFSNKRFVSEGSAYLTLRAMEQLARVGLENLHKDKKIFAWKSGTSYGLKDAWAAGTSPRYTLVVWVGNFTGEPNANLFGARSAGRLLFELLGELEGLDLDFRAQGVQSIKLDSLTGYRLTPELESLDVPMLQTLYPVDALPLRPSPFIKVFWSDAQGKELNSLDSGFENAKQTWSLQLPTNVLYYYDTQHINIASHLRAVSKQNRVLKFIYPTDGLKIIEPIDFEGKQNLIVRLANLKNQKFFFYVDSQMLPTPQSTSFNLTLTPGMHNLYIIGEDGTQDSVSFEIVR